MVAVVVVPVVAVVVVPVGVEVLLDVVMAVAAGVGGLVAPFLLFMALGVLVLFRALGDLVLLGALALVLFAPPSSFPFSVLTSDA